MKILIVDDNEQFRSAVEAQLRLDGYEVFGALDGVTGLELARRELPDLVITDVRMPGMDGWDFCRRLREVSDVPILMLTAQAVAEEDIVKGLDLGADDYMIKPFGTEELRARIRALLRRGGTDRLADKRDLYVDSYLMIDLTARRVLVKGEAVSLTPTEFALLAIFLRNRGRVLTTEHILREVWGLEHLSDTHYPRVYVARLRQKLEQDPDNPRYFLTEYGVGYRFGG
jgi:two-component system KDP operon response regulator KdpE